MGDVGVSVESNIFPTLLSMYLVIQEIIIKSSNIISVMIGFLGLSVNRPGGQEIRSMGHEGLALLQFLKVHECGVNQKIVQLNLTSI